MKILYAVQGTGNGHLSRAIEMVPVMKKFADVDVLVSGIDNDIKVPFEIKYKLYGMGFIFGKKGGIDFWQTFRKSKLRRFLKEIKTVPIDDYDLIINDFEPVTAWAAYLRRHSIVGFGNQHSLLSDKVPRPPKKDFIGDFVIRWYAPTGKQYAFHFQSYDHFIYSATIRRSVRQIVPTNKGHITVYLPAYSDKRVIDVLEKIENVQWELFSKEQKLVDKQRNITIKPITADGFMDSLSTSDGVLTGGGFATPAEAMFLRKKLLVIPMKGQYEQQCNAAALEQLGVTSIPTFGQEQIDHIKKWLEEAKPVEIEFPDNSETIISKIVSDFKAGQIVYTQDVKPVWFIRRRG